MRDRDEPLSPLRRRMIEDMEVRGFTACTQRGYIAAVKNFTTFLGRSPDQGGAEDLRRFQHHMRTQGASATSMNFAVSALRFFFGVCLGRGDAEVGMITVRLPQRLPVILSPAEVARLLEHAPGLKARAALSLAYGAGLRVRPETLCRITEFSEHESNGRELDEGERVAVEVLPVLGQSAAAVEPGDGAFDHPTPGLDDEALHPIGSLDDLGLEIGQDAGQGAVKDRALIGAVGEQFPEKGKQTEQGRQQRETAVAILNVGGGDDAVQQQALRIDQNMPLLALDQLAGIEAVAVDGSPPFSALFTL